MSRRMLVRAAVLLGACCLLVACGKSESEAPKGQVIARVGKTDVTVQELENEFRWAQIPADKRDEAVIRRVLGDLVQRKYLVQKAAEAKLDREPTVLLDLLRNREQILATAYLQRDVAAKSTAIGKGDVDKYMLSKPLMFDKRQLMTVDKVSIALTSSAQNVVEATKNAKTLEEVEKKLTELGVAFNRSMGVISSGEMPENIYNALRGQKADDLFFIPSGSTGTFFKVKGQETRPLAGEEASKLARQQLLMDLLRSEASKNALSAEAGVKYEGEYAKIMTAAPKQ
jgi:EpsD family peptidyl-prolyl cis-trans isomerase